MAIQGQLVLDSGENQQVNALLKALNFHEGPLTPRGKLYLKTAPQAVLPAQE
jgi:hypothetical protein